MALERPAGIPYGYCWCGCGGKTRLITKNQPSRGNYVGEPARFLVGHNRRRSPVDYVVDPFTGCWVWAHSATTHGYGRINRDGFDHAHRWYYTQANGPIPPRLEIDHLCFNRLCVNPQHLEAVTTAENLRRMRRRHVRKLTHSDVRAIRASKEGPTALARRYGVNRNHITQIRQRKTWAELD